MKRTAAILILALIAMSLFSCGRAPTYKSDTFFAMDTIIDIKIPENEYDESAVFDACEKIVSDIEKDLSVSSENGSTGIANSDVDIVLDVGSDFEKVLTKALSAAEKTDGAFDPTVGILTSLWKENAENGTVPSERDIKNALQYVGFDKIAIENHSLMKADKSIRIDLGAIGKGYAEEQVVKYLLGIGISGGILSFGGNVAVFGSKDDGTLYRVSIRDPFNTEDVIGILNLRCGYISVSGDYERYIEIGDEKYNHIIDPASGMPVSGDIHSVAVICEDGTLADALSTALFVMGKDASEEFYRAKIYDFETIIVTDDGVFASDGLEDLFDAKKGVKVSYFG